MSEATVTKTPEVSSEVNTESNEPKFNLPTTPEEIAKISFGSPMVDMGIQTVLNIVTEIKGIERTLDSQKDSFSDKRLMEMAEESDNAAVKASLEKYTKILESVEKFKADLIAKVKSTLGDAKLSEEEVAKLKDERSEKITTAKAGLKFITDNSYMVPADQKVNWEAFLEAFHIPGTRGSGASSSTTGTGEIQRPRLQKVIVYTDKVAGGSATFENITKALPLIRKAVENSGIKPNDITTQWMAVSDVTSWKDANDGKFEFTSGDKSVEIYIEKLAGASSDEESIEE